MEDAAKFAFSPGTSWTTLQEVKLKDGIGQSAGNIDIVLVAYDEKGKVLDFCSLEIQAVYISGNVRRPFEYYLEHRFSDTDFTWTTTSVRPDYLSSSRKRLLPQMIYKGNIFKTWNKKQAVAIHKDFYETLPELPSVPLEQADVAWQIYDLNFDKAANRYKLIRHQTVYTKFRPALDKIINPPASNVNNFMEKLQEKLDEKLDVSAPDAPTLTDIIINED